MFVAKLRVEIAGPNYDEVQKKMKAFKALAKRHGVILEVTSFGGDNLENSGEHTEGQQGSTGNQQGSAV